MDSAKRAVPQGSPRRNPRAMEADENATPRRPVAAGSASPQRKKVLGDRNGGGRGEGDGGSAAKGAGALTPPPHPTGGAGTYDPKTNYTTPRPDFLRYDPNRSREIILRNQSRDIILRLEREVGGDSCSSAATSATELSEVVSSGSSARGSDSECDDADEEKEVAPPPAQGGRWVRRLLLLLVSSACLFCYIYCMSSASFPAASEEPLSFVGLNGSMNDVGFHEVAPLLGPIQYEHEADIGQFVDGDSEDGIPLHGPVKMASPSNFMAVAMMGMADTCPNVPVGEFTCQIGDKSSENVDVLKEDLETGELKSEASMRSPGNAEEISEVVCSDGDVTGVPIGSIHSDDMEEDKQGLVPQEIGEDDSEHSMPQLVTMDEILESENVKIDTDDKGLESENLDQELGSWEYENTAEAAKKLVGMVKILWSAMEPHFLKMLACLSIAGFVTVMFNHSQRSRKVNVPVTQRMPAVAPSRVPVLASHNIAPRPVFLPEQPVQPIMPKQESSACLERPVKSLLSESDQSVCLNVPSIGHRNDNDQKVQQQASGIERASDGSTMDDKDIDRSKPPVVQLLGEFSFVDADSSRRRSVKDSIQHGGDATVLESVSSRKRVVKMQKDSDKMMQTPGVQAARRKETAAEEQKMGATPTPLRRSSRLRKQTSP